MVQYRSTVKIGVNRMKKIICFLLSLLTCACFAVGATACGCNGGAGGTNTEQPDDGGNTGNPDDGGNTGNPDDGGNTGNPDDGGAEQATKLKKPTFTFANGVLSWEEMEGAVAYEYKFTIDGQAESTTETSLELTDYCTVYVRAVGDGKTTLTGLWGTFVYEAPTKLTIPQGSVQLNLTSGVVTWTKDVYSVKYVYKIGEDGEVTDGGNSGSLTLNEGETIYFKAIGDGVKYVDSDWLILPYTSSGNGGVEGFE